MDVLARYIQYLNNRVRSLFVAIFHTFYACNPSSKKQAGDSDIQTELSEVFPENPSREGYEGFQWQTVTGAGLRLWAQCNENLRIVTDASIPGARIERMENGHKQTSDPVI
jgi:hypothetical protein